MQPIKVPTFEPCGQCAGGKVLRNGKSEQCDCWINWWHSVKDSIVGDAKFAAQRSERKAS